MGEVIPLRQNFDKPWPRQIAPVKKAPEISQELFWGDSKAEMRAPTAKDSRTVKFFSVCICLMLYGFVFIYLASVNHWR